MAKDRRCLDDQCWEVAIMASAGTVMAVYSDREDKGLESRMRSKDSCPVWGEGAGKVPDGNSPTPYSTARPFWEGGGVRSPSATRLLLGFSGPRHEAEEVKRRVGQFLREALRLELSEAKTLITHARDSAARFLGYEVVALHADERHDQRGQRIINGLVRLKVPNESGSNAAATCAMEKPRIDPSGYTMTTSASSAN